MNLEEIADINRATREYMDALRAGKVTAGNDARAYYGYVDVDVYDCPPFVMFTNNDAPAVDAIVSKGTYEPCSIGIWCALARGATGILDVGAHVGIYSLCAARIRPDALVHAVEPNPYAFARLRMHKHVNNLPNLIEHPVALGEKDTFVKFAWNLKPGGHITSGACITKHEGPEVESIGVPMVTPEARGIAATLGQRPLIKIDVEGSERRVFRALAQIVETAAADIIVETFIQEACDELNPRLAALGYRTYFVREDAKVIEPRRGLQPARPESNDYNQLLTRRSPAELAALLPAHVKVAAQG